MRALAVGLIVGTADLALKVIWLAGIVVLVAFTATPARAVSLIDWAHCRLYPSHERCRPPAPPAEPVQAPVVAPPPVPVYVPPPPVATPQAPPQAAPVAVPAVHPKTAVRHKAKPKPKYKPVPVRKRMAATRVATWCARVPKGTSMGQIEFFAALKGVKMTAANRAKAQACLNSK